MASVLSGASPWYGSVGGGCTGGGLRGTPGIGGFIPAISSGPRNRISRIIPSSGRFIIILPTSPVFARPVTGRKNVFFLFDGITIVPRPKILAAPWLVFLDCHVWIAVADNLDLIAFLCQDLELLVSPRCSDLFIVTRESLTPVDERSTFGSLDALDISHSF
jgi:hypothetical protein